MSAIYNGNTFGATLNFIATVNSPYTAVTTSVNYNTIDGFVKQNVPILTPYGVITVPPDNENCAYIGTSAFLATAIIGYTNSLDGNSNASDLIKGELGLLSAGNFAIKAKLAALQSTFTNSANATITTTLAISENIVLVLIDIMKEIIALETAVNTMVSTYNLHTHPVSGSATLAPNQPQSSYTATSRFTSDYAFINQTPSQMYVNINGVVLT